MTARDYIWNADGEVGGINDKLRGCLVFSYDRSGWLTGRTGQMYDHDHYYYDKAGNLLKDEYQSAVMDNRLPGYGRDRYRYNEWGELTERRDQQLEWNAQGQLTRVISSNSESAAPARCAGQAHQQGDLWPPYGPEGTAADNVCVGRIPAVAGDNVAGKADIPVRRGTTIHAGGGHHGARREPENLALPHGPDGNGTGGDGVGREAGVGAGYLAGFGENRGDISNERGVL